MILYTLTFILLATQLLDWWTTHRILKNGGVEKNPIARRGMEIFGVDGYLGLKTIFATAAGYWIGSHSIEILVALIVFYIGIIFYNKRSL